MNHDEHDIPLYHFGNEQYEDEFRGPRSQENSVTILNRAVDLLTSPENNGRARKFTNGVRQIIKMLTSEGNPTNLGTDDAPDDEDNLLESQRAESHNASLETIKNLEMADGFNGQRRRSTKSIEGLYPRFQPYMLIKYRILISKGPTLRDIIRRLDDKVITEFIKARNRYMAGQSKYESISLPTLQVCQI